MPTNAKSFNRVLKEFAKTILPEQVYLAQKKIAFDLLTQIVLRTPVDTGRARANWQVTVGTPATTVLLETDETGQATIGKFNSEALGNFPATIFLTNNVNYIVPLEEGHGSYPPQKMVGLALQSVENSLTNFLL